MKDSNEVLADPGRGTGDDGHAAVESEGGEGIRRRHSAASYGASPLRRSDVVLLGIFFAVISAWIATLVLQQGITPLRATGGLLVIAGATTAVAGLLRVNSAREAGLTGALRDTATRSDVLFAVSPDPMWLWDPTTMRILDANAATTRVLGWSRDELLRMSIGELQVDHSPRELRTIDYAGEWNHRRKDGSVAITLVSTSPVVHDGITVNLSLAHDLTAERANDARTRAIVDSASDAIFTIDLDGCVESANPGAERMFGRTASDLVAVPVSTLMRATDGSPLVGPVPGFDREVVGIRLDGTTFPLELAVQDVRLGDRTVSTVIARDITERKALERRLTSQATHDPLTGLPNRVLLIDRLTHALSRAERTGRSVAVLFCDLDRFKIVNDSLGHTAGDALLFAAANRFRSAVRTGDTVARFGGDEFVVLAENLADDTDAVRVAEQITASLGEPVRIGNQDLHVTSSIGIAVGRPGRDTAEALVRDADAAMYRAKNSGRARFEMFDSDLRLQALQRLEIEGAMRAGLEHDEFVVHYQPEIELASGRIVGLEALVRWERPGEGTRSPAAFLPVAEETGLIVPLGQRVLHQACAEATRWHAELGDRAPTVWVNVSARELASLDFIAMVDHAVRELLPGPHALGLEITETDIVPDDDLSRRTMEALIDMGLRLAIDDFGTGYASLSYLWRFPADVVKIDQTFVRKMEEDRDAVVLVKAMIDMAHSLGKTIVAEGVETEEQLARLRRLGADTVQGYLFAKPQPASSIDALLTV
jgi:diguanylate cyclase (GGDEF)-like protein/PAS domain S-box-containing protein